MKNRTDNNFNFLKRYQSQLIKNQQGKIKQILNKIVNISTDQRLEWIQINQRKCFQLYKTYENIPHHPQIKKLLLNKLALFLSITKQFRVDYDHKGIQKIIKKINYSDRIQNQSHNQIVKSFTEYDFDIYEYDYLIYEEGWFNKIVKWFTND